MVVVPEGEQVQSFRNLIIERCEEDVGKCIQCGKCSSGCPLAAEMEYIPNQIMELIRLNQEEKVRREGLNLQYLLVLCQLPDLFHKMPSRYRHREGNEYPKKAQPGKGLSTC